MTTSSPTILLVSPSSETRFEPVPHIGLMNLFLIAEELGCAVELADLTTLSHSRAVRRMLEKRYDIVGVSCSFTSSAPYFMRYAREIKERHLDTLVVGGGHHASFVPEDLLGNGYDLVVLGEAELTWRELLERFKEGRSLADLRGTAVLKNNEVHENEPRDLIEDLDTLPFNDFSRFDLTPYFKRAGLPYLHMMTSRGCVYRCKFCSSVRMWQCRFRAQSPARVLKEFHAAKAAGVEFVSIEDDDFAIDEERIRGICELLTAHDCMLPWAVTIGSRSIKENSTLALMKSAGCIEASVSIESANPRILRAYGKGFRVSDNTEMCKRLHEHGILVHNKGLIGFPDETVRESLRTCLHLANTSDISHLSILEPRPGCDYWFEWDRKGDTSQYPRFGKGNVFFARRRFLTWFLFRFYAALYLLNPRRMYRAAFAKDPAVRFLYRKYYVMAFWTLRANFVDFFKRPGHGGS